MIITKIREDIDKHRKLKEFNVVTILSTLYSECAIIGKNKGKDTTDDECISTIKRFIKYNEDNIKASPERKDKYLQENDLYSKYLPKQLTEDEIVNIINAIRHEGIKFQEVMRYFKEIYTNRYDGKLLSSITKTILGE